MMSEIIEREKWMLKSIKIEFKKGYSFEKTEDGKKDRYEGEIKFENGESESFCFKVRADMADKYISLLANDIVLSASSLGERLIESLGLSKPQQEDKQ